MSEEKDHKRRWSGYVCPDCRLVFRVPRDHDGLGVVCPSCRRLLKLPVQDVLTAGPVVAAGGEGGGAVETGDAIPVSGVGSSGGKWLLAGAAACVLLLSLGALAVWFKAKPAPAAVLSVPVPVVGSPPPAVPVAGNPLDLMTEPATVNAAEELVQMFLKADTIDEMLPLVLHPEISGKRMRRHYLEKPVRTGNVLEIGSLDVPDLTKPLYACDVITAGGKIRTLFVHVTNSGLFVDWESWAGWSELSWKEFMEAKPVRPVLFRVRASSVDYYNMAFVDENVWQSYTLQSPDGEQVLYGYMKRDSAEGSRIRLDEDQPTATLTVLLKFPEDAKTSNQVIIESIVSDDWLEKNPK